MKKTFTVLSICLMFLIVNFSCSSCKKDNSSTQNSQPDNPWGLPNATQTGANTLGFLLNGQPWTPQGYNGTANLSLYYDAGYNGGVFNIAAYQIINAAKKHIVFFGDSIQSPKKIILPNNKLFGMVENNNYNNCNYDTGDSTTRIIQGFFDIQKLDKVQQIFSGQFEVTIINSTCDTLRITSGRFDLKY